MEQLKVMLKRLKNPSVIISIVSQIATILTLLNVSINIDAMTQVIVAVCSVLVLLGIMSDPKTENKGYGDDLEMCNNCNKLSPHVKVGENMVCSECGNIRSENPGK